MDPKCSKISPRARLRNQGTLYFYKYKISTFFLQLFTTLSIQSNTMAQMVKAIRMIIKIDSTARSEKPPKTPDIVIEDDAPKRKPSLEEIDALEVISFAH